jgi:hypothetical protein
MMSKFGLALLKIVLSNCQEHDGVDGRLRVNGVYKEVCNIEGGGY